MNFRLLAGIGALIVTALIAIYFVTRKQQKPVAILITSPGVTKPVKVPAKAEPNVKPSESASGVPVPKGAYAVGNYVHHLSHTITNGVDILYMDDWSGPYNPVLRTAALTKPGDKLIINLSFTPDLMQMMQANNNDPVSLTFIKVMPKNIV
jgi:hypothetical protein